MPNISHISGTSSLTPTYRCFKYVPLLPSPLPPTVQGTVTSCLDYYNNFLPGLPFPLLFLIICSPRIKMSF